MGSTYLITGGGSGGHIYPALAVAEELCMQEASAKVILVGAKRGLENQIFSKTSYKSYLLPIGPLHSSVGQLRQLKTILLLPYCFLKSIFILLYHRPKVVFGVGGYASGPVGLMALFLRTPVCIWEGNATPGWTNRILGRFSKVKPFLVFPESKRFFKSSQAVITGVPIRKGMEDPQVRSADEKFTVLFVGGSQGARVFNQVVPVMVSENLEKLCNINIIHQTGFKNKHDVDEVYKNLAGPFPNVEVKAYLDPIRDYYQRAHVVVSRAGAGAVNEISMLGKASVLVPFPKASDDHQKSNAQSMVSKGAALMLEEAEFTKESLLRCLLDLKENSDKLIALEKASREALPKGAREQICSSLKKI